MTGRTTDIDRALANVRSRADHLRYTIGKLEHNLAWNPTITWPELLGQYTVISKQLENISDEIPEMIQHFVCIPKMSTPNPADIPLLLRTRMDPEMEEVDEKLIEESKEMQANLTWDQLKMQMEQHNEFCETIQDTYKDMSEAFIKEMKVDKYTVKEERKPVMNGHFSYMEEGIKK